MRLERHLKFCVSSIVFSAIEYFSNETFFTLVPSSGSRRRSQRGHLDVMLLAAGSATGSGQSHKLGLIKTCYNPIKSFLKSYFILAINNKGHLNGYVLT